LGGTPNVTQTGITGRFSDGLALSLDSARRSQPPRSLNGNFIFPIADRINERPQPTGFSLCSLDF
jgi:hypothetical protein